MTAFLKKEWMETIRTGRGIILLMIFILFGIMNPAMAKLTPWMWEMLSGSLHNSGIIVDNVTVDAMTSWTQFYKNIPIALMIFVLMCSGSFTGEYHKGTLIPVVTKGLSRRRIAAAKIILLTIMWTAGFFLCFGITAGYNAYFWDNGIAEHYVFGGACYWLLGVWVVGWMAFFSTVTKNNIQVMLGTGGIFIAAYMLGLLPKLKTYIPVKLMDGMALLQGAAAPDDYWISIIVAGVMAAVCVVLSFICFDRKRLD